MVTKQLHYNWKAYARAHVRATIKIINVNNVAKQQHNNINNWNKTTKKVEKNWTVCNWKLFN